MCRTANGALGMRHRVAHTETQSNAEVAVVDACLGSIIVAAEGRSSFLPRATLYGDRVRVFAKVDQGERCASSHMQVGLAGWRTMSCIGVLKRKKKGGLRRNGDAEKSISSNSPNLAQPNYLPPTATCAAIVSREALPK